MPFLIDLRLVVGRETGFGFLFVFVLILILLGIRFRLLIGCCGGCVGQGQSTAGFQVVVGEDLGCRLGRFVLPRLTCGVAERLLREASSEKRNAKTTNKAKFKDKNRGRDALICRQ